MSEKKPKKRVVLFTSYYRGMAVLKRLFADRELMDKIDIVGVVTDIPGKNCAADKRHWQYGYTPEEAVMVEKLAEKHGIPVYSGKVKTLEFYQMLKEQWKPDIAYMGTFGQKLDKQILDTVPEGVFNTHPYDGAEWPSKEYAGLPAFQNVLKNHLSEFVLALHVTNENLDDGPLIYTSPPVRVPYQAMEGMEFGKQVQHLHKVMAPVAADLIDTHLRRTLGLPVSYMARAAEPRNAGAKRGAL